MINIDSSSAQITANTSGALPNATAGLVKGGLHLTKGYISPDAVPATNSSVLSPVEITGTVDVLADTQAEADQILSGSWFFGFLQVARLKRLSASWQGRRTGEGSVDLLVAGFPVSNDIVALDSDPANQPFYTRSRHVGISRRPPPGQRRRVSVQASITDHPNYREFLITENAVTKSRNFLHRMAFEVAFTSVLVGRDGNGPIQPLAHINWKLNLAGEFKWLKGKPKGSERLASLEMGKSAVGSPADPAVNAIVGRPGPPLIKGLVIDRWRAARANPRMRQESATRSLLVPKDFFR